MGQVPGARSLNTQPLIMPPPSPTQAVTGRRQGENMRYAVELARIRA